MRTLKILLIYSVILVGFQQVTLAQKIGFTTIEYVMSLDPKVVQANKDLDSYEKLLSQKLKIFQDDFQNKLSSYTQKSQQGTLDDDKKKALEAELRTLQEDLQKKAAESDEKLAAKRDELLSPIQERIQKAIDEISKAEGYTHIINNALGNGFPTVLYADESIDITPKLLGKLGIKVDDN
jgi:outer membrane protein